MRRDAAVQVLDVIHGQVAHRVACLGYAEAEIGIFGTVEYVLIEEPNFVDNASCEHLAGTNDVGGVNHAIGVGGKLRLVGGESEHIAYFLLQTWIWFETILHRGVGVEESASHNALEKTDSKTDY